MKDKKLIDKTIAFLFYLVFIFFSLGQIGRLSLNNQEINFYLYELLLIIIFIFFLIKAIKIKFGIPAFAGMTIRRLGMTFVLVLITIFWFFLTYFLNFKNFTLHQNLVAGLYLIRLLFYFSFFVFLFSLFKNNLRIEISLRRSFNFFIVLTLMISLVQYFLYPNLRNILYLGWDPHWYRLLGGFFDSFLAGAIFGLLSIYFLFRKLPILSLTFFIFLILTFSRNAYLSFLVFFVVYLLKLKKWKSLFIFILFFLLVIFLIPKPFGESVNLKRIFTIEARINDYQKGWQIWKENWFFGIGYNRIRYLKEIDNSIKPFGYSHAGANFTSSYLTILVTTGIIGFILFLLSVRKILMINQFAFYGGLFLLTMSFFDNVILHPMVVFLYLMIVFLF